MTHQTAKDIAARRRAARRQEYRGRLLTVAEVLDILGSEGKPLPRRTWQQWRRDGKAPRCHKLPNGSLRCREDDLESWLESLVDDLEAAK